LAVFCAGTILGSGRLDASGPPDRAESLQFDPASGRWIAQAPPVPGTADGDLRIARALHAGGKHARAYRAIQKWFKAYGEDNALYPNAVLVRAKIRIARRDYYKAHQELQAFLSRYAGTEYVDQAIQLEFIIAERFLSGTRRKFWGVRLLKADDVGIAILDDLAVNYPDTTIAELAILTKAGYYFGVGDYTFAEHEYATLMSRFPRSRYTRKSLLQTAKASLASFAGIDYDDAPLIEAFERYRQYAAHYAGAAEQEGIGLILDDITETRASKELTIGDYYIRAGHQDAGVFYYQSTINNWPDSIAASRARDRLAAMGMPPPPGSADDPAANQPRENADEPVAPPPGTARTDSPGQPDSIVEPMPVQPTSEEPASARPDAPRRPVDARGGESDDTTDTVIIDLNKPGN